MPNIALELGKQSTQFGVTAAYGEQQDVAGVRIVPVALVWAGYGGGSDEQGNGDRRAAHECPQRRPVHPYCGTRR